MLSSLRGIDLVARCSISRSLTVRRYRPARQDVRPGFRDAPAISQRHGVGGCPLARRKGNVVSYTLLQKRRSQKQGLKRRSASRALCWTHEKDARLFVAARVMAQHQPTQRLMPMMHPQGKCVQHALCHRASTHYSFPSSAAAHEEEREWSHSDQDRKRGKVWRGFEELPPHLLPHAGSASPLIFKASGGIAGSGSTFFRRTRRILHQETDCGGDPLADGRERRAERPPKKSAFTWAQH